jgi:DNA-binding HxlR family transcriptional regulator
MCGDLKAHLETDAPLDRLPNGSSMSAGSTAVAGDNPAQEAFQILGQPWNLLILREVFDGVSRFAELRRSLGISGKVLSRRLTALVGSGILERHTYQPRPPRFDYLLTAKGRALGPALAAVADWGDRFPGLRGDVPMRPGNGSTPHEQQGDQTNDPLGAVIGAGPDNHGAASGVGVSPAKLAASQRGFPYPGGRHR